MESVGTDTTGNSGLGLALAGAVVSIARNLPRGGARLTRAAAAILPHLRRYPIEFFVGTGATLHADLRNPVFYPLLMHGCYPHQQTEDLIVLSLLQPGDVVIDVGANVGFFALVSAAAVGPTGSIFSFEPSRVTSRFLKELAGQVPQITAVELALSDTPGPKTFSDEFYSDRSHLSPSSPTPNSYEVQCTTVDVWASETGIRRIDLLKIDAEGHDAAVIRGASNMITTFAPAIEFEVDSVDSGHEIKAALDALPNRTLYQVFTTHSGYPLHTRSGSTILCNYFALTETHIERIPEMIFRYGFLRPVDF